MLSTIRPVDPLQLHRHWPFIARALNAIRDKAGRTQWWNEDVYASLQFRAAAGYIVEVKGYPVGFFVVHPQAVPWVGETELFLWICWSAPLAEWPVTPDEHNLVAYETLAFIAKLALDAGHSQVSTLTVRRGLMRQYPNLWEGHTYPCSIGMDKLRQLVAREVVGSAMAKDDNP